MSHTERRGLGDILVDRELSAGEIIAGLGRALGLRPEGIFLIDEIEQVLEQPASASVVCQRSVREAEDYPLLLSLWGAVDRVRPFATIVAELCKEFDCRCLIDDGSANPYSWLRIDREGGVQLLSYYGP